MGVFLCHVNGVLCFKRLRQQKTWKMFIACNLKRIYMLLAIL
ncbi:hypothetical protein KR50_16230 [Jeotgalibacillus campisalis]|uniref:Uncharacterized protein n=1 Tax=Jeotgalibacillus campisalis TaxID=220754 RepID=A0A0C2VSP6_9BACL|nr:hypothetical protein KR50_16230 [Jeotgalibacillus campisalis]